jgi:hypothetical protein
VRFCLVNESRLIDLDLRAATLAIDDVADADDPQPWPNMSTRSGR